MAVPTNLLDAHRHCSRHREEILASEKCGCFYCLKTFPPDDIKDWIDEPQTTEKNFVISATALCPHCGIDSVLGSKSGYAITEEFLRRMNQYWFS